jgi:hypothetical protein
MPSGDGIGLYLYQANLNMPLQYISQVKEARKALLLLLMPELPTNKRSLLVDRIPPSSGNMWL